MNNVKILIVEDDVDINQLLCRILEKEGYCVRSAYSGTEAKMCVEHYEYDLLLLDLMLPGIHGETLIEEIRKLKTMPIIVLSAKTAQEDKIHTLKLGADDFISKPFDVNEVVARVEAQLRRYKQFSKVEIQETKLKHKNCLIDIEAREVIVNGQLINLTVREFALLELFMMYPNKVFTKADLFSSVWNSENYGDDNTVNVHISHLRSKLAKADGENEYIATVWGIGFKLKE
ncbi:MAG: response regulator transcription factor [Bacillaceae bacterium]